LVYEPSKGKDRLDEADAAGRQEMGNKACSISNCLVEDSQNGFDAGGLLAHALDDFAANP
jgi:hypothetical protein